METVYTKNRKPIVLSPEPFESGGEGSIYKIASSADFTNHCVKIFATDKIRQKQSKLEYMVRNKPEGITGSHHLVCWPSELIFNGKNEFIGYVMPLAFGGSRSLLGLTNPKLQPLGDFDFQKFDRATRNGMRARMAICCNILLAIYYLHEKAKCVIVDCKPQNILFSDNGSISIIDVDSFQITTDQDATYYSEVVTFDYAPAELETTNPISKRISPAWDRFSIAVCMYQILLGIHPYAGTANGQFSNKDSLDEKIRSGLFVHGSMKQHLIVTPPPHRTFFTVLPQSVQNLFHRAFDAGHKQPSLRPPAEEWYKALNLSLQT